MTENILLLLFIFFILPVVSIVIHATTVYSLNEINLLTITNSTFQLLGLTEFESNHGIIKTKTIYLI